jgi:hypothetical protein
MAKDEISCLKTLEEVEFKIPKEELFAMAKEELGLPDHLAMVTSSAYGLYVDLTVDPETGRVVGWKLL